MLQKIEIGLHTQFIGEILDIKAEAEVLDEKGRLDIEKVQPFFFAPEANTDYGVGKFLGEAFSIGRDVPKKPLDRVKQQTNGNDRKAETRSKAMLQPAAYTRFRQAGGRAFSLFPLACRRKVSL